MENKNYRFVSFLPDAQKKIPKKLKKLNNTIADSFQAKIDSRRMRKRENKNYRSVTFLSDVQQKIPKKTAKQFKKLKKYHYGFISSHNRLEKTEKERK